MDAKEARDLLKRLPICVVATSTRDGHPWSTPLFYNYTPDFRFVWESEKEAHHSQLLASNDRVAIVVADFQGDDPTQSLYFEASAREVPPGELGAVVETFWHGPHTKTDRTPLTAADYQGNSPLRLYISQPLQAYTLAQVEVEGGHKVERRVNISIL